MNIFKYTLGKAAQIAWFLAVHVPIEYYLIG